MQLLLTFEPSIVERSASLLTRLVEDNPTLPRLYLSGAFFFALMYTGSNVLPLIRFLHVAHLQQLYQDEESGSASGLAARSYLTLILPQAMVCCLEVHGPDQFADGGNGSSQHASAHHDAPSSAHHDAPSPPRPPQVHGPDKFAEIFLGEFDTPEYIWNHEMRRRMIEKLSLHVGEFPILLQANCTAKYDYCPLPRIAYPELAEEIFCHRYA